MSQIRKDHLDRYVERIQPQFEGMLKKIVEIPTVSAVSDPKVMAKGAQTAAAILRDFGAKSEVIPTKGNPLIFGCFDQNPAYPTVTVYNHMDVQPADGPEWVRPPFEMSIEKGRYYGRGTTDDKGPGISVLMAAAYAVQNEIPINIHFLWEMEEEIGSPNFETAVKKNRRKFATDSVIVSDTIWIARGKPAVSYGLRGMQGLLLRLETGKKDVHSGLTGGIARNPIGELADVIAQCYDAKTGKIKIPGFYKDVAKLSAKEKQSFADSGFTLPEFKRAHELKSLRKLSVQQATEAIWSQPTFEVHGIAGGYQGPGVKTIVPAWAEAKISTRLVPKMKPHKVVAQIKKFIKKINPDVTVHAEHELEPYLGKHEGPYAEAAVEALEFGFGKTPAFVREGGSIGAVLTMNRVLNCPVNFIGLSLPEHGYHAPNENYDWEQASGGVKTFVRYFEILSEMKRRGR